MARTHIAAGAGLRCWSASPPCPLERRRADAAKHRHGTGRRGRNTARHDDRLPAQTRVVAIRGESETIAVVLDHLSEQGVLETTLDREPIVVLHQPGIASALDTAAVADGRDVGATGVFTPPIEGRRLDLERGDDGHFIDRATGTTFDILGRALQGELAGSALTPLEHLDTFWFAIAAFKPAIRVIAR
ncbi:MAG: DUF3179 domain-containing (seleno)protein [Acidimicrobiales bacterium]